MVCLGAFAVSLLFSWGLHHAGLPRPRWDALSDLLMGDLMEYPATFQSLHHAAFFYNTPPASLPAAMFSAVAYPPFASALLAALYFVPHPTFVFLTVAIAWLGTVLFGVGRTLGRLGVHPSVAILLPASLLLISFPVQRLLHQGNIELAVWILASTGTYAFFGQRYSLAAGLWGAAAAVKLYPLLLLTLLFPKKRYGALIVGAAVFLGVSWLSLYWMGPTVTVAWHGSLHNVFGYQHLRASEWSFRELVANHSAFSFVKLATQIAHTSSSNLTFPYYLGGASLFIWAFFRKLARLPLTNQLLGVTVCMVSLPTVSYYHTLVHLFTPLLALMLDASTAQRAGIYIRGLRTSLLLFIPLLMPYTLFTFPQSLLFCGLIQTVVLGALFLCALEFPFFVPTLQGTIESA